MRRELDLYVVFQNMRSSVAAWGDGSIAIGDLSVPCALDQRGSRIDVFYFGADREEMSYCVEDKAISVEIGEESGRILSVTSLKKRVRYWSDQLEATIQLSELGITGRELMRQRCEHDVVIGLLVDEILMPHKASVIELYGVRSMLRWAC